MMLMLMTISKFLADPFIRTLQMLILTSAILPSDQSPGHNIQIISGHLALLLKSLEIGRGFGKLKATHGCPLACRPI